MSIPALIPARQPGHQFVCYADCCSGVPAAPHEANFAAINHVIAQLAPPPQFICFPGDEIIGLSANSTTLRAQWAHWLDHEMAWLDRQSCPIYHTTGNHTAYDEQSSAIFREALPHLPKNGPGLSYFVRKDNLLMIFVDTMGNGIGGEGRVETQWLAETLVAHSDASQKLVFGHHPVFPINGFSGPFSRELAPEYGQAFWQVLVENGVTAYFCSHILAFDVQAHAGVLQIVTAGAGTRYRMPPEIEYLHAMQVALEPERLRYQVLDIEGALREWLVWPFTEPDNEPVALAPGEQAAPAIPTPLLDKESATISLLNFSGIAADSAESAQQTLLAQYSDQEHLADFVIVIQGADQRLNILFSQAPGRSPHLWRGPSLTPGQPFSIEIAIHPAMGPGGFMWRLSAESPWHSFHGTSAWGADRFTPATTWAIGHGQQGPSSTPFRGTNLQATIRLTKESLR